MINALFELQARAIREGIEIKTISVAPNVFLDLIEELKQPGVKEVTIPTPYGPVVVRSTL